jgi:ribonuclease P protein component
MLPAAYRMRASSDFATAIRSGRRARCGGLVVYLQPGTREQTVVGLVVGKAVGASVVRHAVSRRLRAQLAQRLESVPVGAQLVVRALPEAAKASSASLGRDLDKALVRLATRPVGSR